MTTRATKTKALDAVEMKRAIQARIAEETEGLSPEELIDYYERKVAEGPLADWWARLRQRSAEDKSGRS